MARTGGSLAVKGLIQHHCNAVHVYCLLMKLGLPTKVAFFIARKWQTVCHRVIY